MGYASKLLRIALLGAALAAPSYIAKAQQPQNQQQSSTQNEIRLTTNYSEGDKFACAGYWVNNPRVRFCYENTASKDSFSISSYIPFSKDVVRVAAIKEGQKEEAGIYFQHGVGKRILLGAAAEYLDGRVSGEAHAVANLTKRHKAFAGYGNVSGTSIATIGDFFNIGKYHTGALASFKSSEISNAFGSRRQVLLNIGRENVFKFFYRDDGKARSFTGFARFGKKGSNRYTPRAFFNDRLDFAEFTLRQSRAEQANIPLRPENTHLSDHGTCAFAPRISSSSTAKLQEAEVFCTLGERWIGGYKFSRKENKSGTAADHTLSGGVNLGPAKLILGWNTDKGFYVYASLVHRID